MSSWFHSQEVEHPGLPVIFSSLLDLSTIRCFCMLLSTCEHGISAIQLYLSSVYKTLASRTRGESEEGHALQWAVHEMYVIVNDDRDSGTWTHACQ
jgi:hypothetical protein